MNLPLAFIFWAVMVAAAIVNDVFAKAFLEKFTGAYGAHLYKTAFIVAVIFFGSRLYMGMVKAGGGNLYTYAMSAGLLWLFSSIVFEFIVCPNLLKVPIEKITGEYRISQGRLWSLVLASEVIAPLVNTYFVGRG